MEKDLTIALLKNEYVKAYIKSISVEYSINTIMEVNLTLAITDNTQAELANLVTGNVGKIAIIKL